MHDRAPDASQPRKDAANSDRYFLVAFIVAGAVLLVVAGSLLTVTHTFPGPQLTRAYEGYRAIYAKLFYEDDVYQSDLWNHVRTDKRGVTIDDAGHVSPGATLYTSGHEAAAYLIAMNGEVLHTWRRPFSSVWDESAAVKKPQPDSHVYMRKAHVFENGDLLAIYEGAGDTPYGYGLVKLDKDSNIIWRYLESVHHDFDVAPDGSIFALTQEIVDKPLPQLDHLKSPRLEDYLVTLSSDGKELRKTPLLDVMDKSEFRALLFGISSFALADAMHTNAVHVITEKEAENFAFGKAGQLLMSFREPSALAVIDPDEERLLWAVKAYWSGQHDPVLLANGHILLFDNRGNFNRPEGTSRALEFDPVSMAIAWQYTGTADSPLDSAIRSHVQRLPNGNTLITESNGGRILEVTEDRRIVWEFVNPVRGGPENALIPIICKAERLDAAAVRGFLSL